MKTCILCQRDQGHQHTKCKFCGHEKFGPRWIWVYSRNAPRSKKITHMNYYG